MYFNLKFCVLAGSLVLLAACQSKPDAGASQPVAPAPAGAPAAGAGADQVAVSPAQQQAASNTKEPASTQNLRLKYIRNIL
jgi:uncharacterized lipoprotein YajG